MRNKALSGVLGIIITMMIAFGCMPIQSEAQVYTVDEVQALIDGIVSYKVNEAGAGDLSHWIEKDLTENAGVSAEWYAVALSQDGAEGFSGYRASLEKYLSENKIPSAVTRQKYALALCAVGSRSSYITDVLGDSVGGQGIMSYIYGLHILNNGYVSTAVTADEVIKKLLSMQLSDGGWALWGEYGDIDVTAMTVNSLAPYYKSDNTVKASVDRALDLLSSRQQEDGGFNSFGSPNPESASQVLTALSALGIDCQKDERFVKNGRTIIDGITDYRLPDGSFAHIKDGPFNESATVQAFYSLIAYKRMKNGKGPLLVMDRRQVQSAETTTVTASSAVTTTTTVQSTAAATSSSAALSEKTSETSASSLGTTSAATETTKPVTTSVSVTEKTSPSSVTAAATITETASGGTSIAAKNELPEAPKPKDHRPAVIAVIIGSAGVLSIAVFAVGKRNYKNFIFIGGAAAIAVVIALMTDIKTKDEYYHGGKIVKDDPIGTVTLEIRCDTIAGKSDSEYIPEDGTILAATEFEIEDGETVFDILTQAAQTYCIQVENRGSSGGAHGMVYIAGINYIYEYDFGDLSGWVYHVNGIAPSRGCGDYVLSDGDRIEWLYTCELGHDLNEVYE